MHFYVGISTTSEMLIMRYPTCLIIPCVAIILSGVYATLFFYSDSVFIPPTIL